MSSKRRRKSKAQKTKDAKAKEAQAAAFASNPLLFPSELTVAQLRKVLSERGVPEQELKQLQRKPLLVERLLKLDSGQKRVAEALDRRTDAVDQRSGGAFARLGLSLVVFIAQFLDNRSLATAACVCKLLRVRLSLSLKGTPSPALVALRSLDLTKVNENKQFMTALSARTQQVERLRLKNFAGYSLPTSLLHLEITGDTKNILPALAKCQRLQTLILSSECAPGAQKPLCWPDLRLLHLSSPSNDAVVCFLNGAPQLQELSLLSVRLDDVRIDPARLSQLRRVKLNKCALKSNRLLSTLPLLEDTHLDATSFDSFTALPKSLISLKMANVQLIPGALLMNHFIALRTLQVRRDDYPEIENLVSGLEGACLPALDSLIIEAFVWSPGPTVALLMSIEEVVVHAALPKLARLRLAFVYQFSSSGLFTHWRQTVQLKCDDRFESLISARSDRKLAVIAVASTKDDATEHQIFPILDDHASGADS